MNEIAIVDLDSGCLLSSVNPCVAKYAIVPRINENVEIKGKEYIVVSIRHNYETRTISVKVRKA